MAKPTTRPPTSKASGKALPPKASPTLTEAESLIMRMRNMTFHHKNDLWAALMEEAAKFIEDR